MRVAALWRRGPSRAWALAVRLTGCHDLNDGSSCTRAACRGGLRGARGRGLGGCPCRLRFRCDRRRVPRGAGRPRASVVVAPRVRAGGRPSGACVLGLPPRRAAGAGGADRALALAGVRPRLGKRRRVERGAAPTGLDHPCPARASQSTVWHPMEVGLGLSGWNHGREYVPMVGWKPRVSVAVAALRPRRARPPPAPPA
jgi:hypothetical protein